MDLIKKYLEEQEAIDTGWKKAQTDRKDEYGNRIKNVARRLARQGMQAAMKDLKKGPEAGKKQVEEVEKLEELKPRTLASYTSKAADQMAHAAIDKSSGAAMGTMGRMSNMPDLAKQGSDKEDKAFKTILKRSKGISSASRRLAKEEVELDEGLNYELKDAPNGGSHVMVGNKRIGTVHAPDSSGVIHGTHVTGDGSLPTTRRSPRAKIFTPSKDVKSMADKIAKYHKRNFRTEEVELDENLNNKLSSLNTTVNKIIKSKESRKSYLQNVASGKSGSFIHQDTAKKLLNKPTKEEVELDEELTNQQKDAHFTLSNKHRLAAKTAKGREKDEHMMAAELHKHALQNPWYKNSHNDAHRLSKKLGVHEEVELDELKEPTVQKYITRAKFSSNPKRRAMALKAQTKLQQKPKPMKTEEVELDEAKLNIDQQIANHEKASDIHYNRYKRAAHRPSGSGSIHSFDAPRDPSTAEAAHYNLYAHHDEAAKHLKAYKETGFKKHLNAYNSSHKHIQSLYKQHRFTAKQANEEVELDESLKKKLAAMGVAATMAASPAAARVSDGGQSFAQQTAQQSSQHQSVKTPKEIPSKSYLQNVASGKSRSLMHPDTAKELLKKHYSEEVDLVSKYSKLGEAKYPGFRVRTTSGYPNLGPKLPRRGYGYVPQGLEDPRTGLPLGFSHPPKKDEPEKEELSKKTKNS